MLNKHGTIDNERHIKTHCGQFHLMLLKFNEIGAIYTGLQAKCSMHYQLFI